MELWDIYDIDRQKTGRTMPRGKVPPGGFFLTVHVCIFNKAGELLIQRRHPQKKDYPNMWDVTAAGCALAGESSAQAASRELFEELGLTHNFSTTRPQITMHFSKGFDDVYLITRDIDLSTLQLQPDEVTDACWASRDKVLQMVNRGEFINYYKAYVNAFFELHDTTDSIIETR